jgi:Asp-tRNA(Asn)/Glu-tRNA(Gln) amidotransferase A subunit family amidase
LFVSSVLAVQAAIDRIRSASRPACRPAVAFAFFVRIYERSMAAFIAFVRSSPNTAGKMVAMYSEISITELRGRYLQGEADPLAVLDQALANSNKNASHNVYLAQDLEWSRNQAHSLNTNEMSTKPLWGIPVSLKDCFDVQGFDTSCGSRFYREEHGIASRDSAVASKLRGAGAILTGKTHLHQLAYGITGENRDFGDCVQPRNPSILTGGSSSGAAASVQEGSAFAGIGTDTGGSIRAPAAMCGLAGFRSSITRQGNLWSGGAHLAPTFDTIGWLYRHLGDGPLLAQVLFDLPLEMPPALPSLRIGIPNQHFLRDCDSDVSETFQQRQDLFESAGAILEIFDASWWEPALGIFAPIQASEAAGLHRNHFAKFQPEIAERLAFGETIDWETAADHHFRLAAFRARMALLFNRFDYLLLPCAPMSALAAGEEHSTTRSRILRYTTPMSLAGLPVVALPGAAGGIQLAGRLGGDAKLLALSAAL